MIEKNTELGRLLSKALQEQITEPESRSQREQAVRKQLMGVGRQVVAEWVNEREEEPPERKVPWPHCGKEAEYDRRREGQLRTMLGGIGFQRHS